MLNAVLKTTAAAIGGDTDRSLEPVLLFCLLGLTLTLAFTGLPSA
jgi:hypothetical protein